MNHDPLPKTNSYLFALGTTRSSSSQCLPLERHQFHTPAPNVGHEVFFVEGTSAERIYCILKRSRTIDWPFVRTYCVNFIIRRASVAACFDPVDVDQVIIWTSTSFEEFLEKLFPIYTVLAWPPTVVLPYSYFSRIAQRWEFQPIICRLSRYRHRIENREFFTVQLRMIWIIIWWYDNPWKKAM